MPRGCARFLSDSSSDLRRTPEYLGIVAHLLARVIVDGDGQEVGLLRMRRVVVGRDPVSDQHVRMRHHARELSALEPQSVARTALDPVGTHELAVDGVRTAMPEEGQGLGGVREAQTVLLEPGHDLVVVHGLVEADGQDLDLDPLPIIDGLERERLRGHIQHTIVLTDRDHVIESLVSPQFEEARPNLDPDHDQLGDLLEPPLDLALVAQQSDEVTVVATLLEDSVDDNLEDLERPAKAGQQSTLLILLACHISPQEMACPLSVHNERT